MTATCLAKSATPLQHWKADRFRRRVAKMLGLSASASERAILQHLTRKISALRQAKQTPAVSEQLAALLGLAASLQKAQPPATVQPAASLADPAKTVELPAPLQAVRASKGGDAQA